MSYSYWVIKFVPEPLRGEYLNVAVLVGKDGEDWSLRSSRNLRALHRGEKDAGSITDWMRGLSQRVDWANRGIDTLDDVTLSAGYIEHLRRRSTNMVRIAPGMPVDTVEAASAADLLFPIFVNEPSSSERASGRRALVAQMRSLYLRRDVLSEGQRLLQRAQVAVGLRHGRFDFAVVDNGIAQASQAWAFDNKQLQRLEDELQSWTYLINRLRDGESGSLMGDGLASPLSLPRDAPIRVVYSPPKLGGKWRNDLFRASMSDWRRLGLRPVEAGEMSGLAADLEFA